MPNFKFNKAFFISFLGERNKNSAKFANSYCKEGDSHSAFESHTIDFRTKHRRKLIPTPQSLPMCRINFAFDGYQGHFINKKLNIDPIKTNTEIAELILEDYLKDVVPYSVIYINAHGKPPNRISQHLLMPDNTVQKCDLTVYHLAELMYKYIPEHAQNNLKIHLLACNGDQICTNFMAALNEKGFRKTCVVGYIGLLKVLLSGDAVVEFSTTERSIPGNRFKHGKKVSDNKKVSHNYNGYIITESYRCFKQTYLFSSLEEKEIEIEKEIEKEIEIEKKEHLILLIDKLKIPIILYIESSQQKDHSFFHFHHKHGRSGRDRARHILNFLSQIEYEVTQVLTDSNRSSSNFEIQFINELRSFAAKTREYRNFSGSINVSNNSCLSYILRALDELYRTQGIAIQSNILKEFAKYLSQRQTEIATTTIFSRGRCDNETERTRLKNRLIALQDNMINSW